MKINNINKKLIAGLLAITLTMPMAGCSMKQETEYFDMQQTEQGWGADNTVTYDNIKDCEVLFMRYEDIEDFVNIYLAYNINGKYYNLFGAEIIENIENEYADKDNLAYYLTEYNKIQEEYTEREVYELMRIILTEYKSKHISTMDCSLNYFDMRQTEQGYRAINTLSYDDIKNCDVLIKCYENDPEFVNVFIARQVDDKYYNIYGGNLIDYEENEYANKQRLVDYLTGYNKILPEYNEESLYEVIRLIESDYQTQITNENIK